jgi:hypothetical protein
LLETQTSSQLLEDYVIETSIATGEEWYWSADIVSAESPTDKERFERRVVRYGELDQLLMKKLVENIGRLVAPRELVAGIGDPNNNAHKLKVSRFLRDIKTDPIWGGILFWRGWSNSLRYKIDEPESDISRKELLEDARRLPLQRQSPQQSSDTSKQAAPSSSRSKASKREKVPRPPRKRLTIISDDGALKLNREYGEWDVFYDEEPLELSEGAIQIMQIVAQSQQGLYFRALLAYHNDHFRDTPIDARQLSSYLDEIREVMDEVKCKSWIDNVTVDDAGQSRRLLKVALPPGDSFGQV